MQATTTTAASEADGKARRPAWTRMVGAVVAGLAAVIAGVAVWFLVRDVSIFSPGWLAIVVGVLIGAAVVVGGGRRGVLPAVLVGILTVLAAVLSQNFVQRQQLEEGIDTLQEQWASLRQPPVGEAGAEPPADAGAPPTTAPGGLDRPLPPPEIAAILPLEALLTIPPEGLAQIWQHVPADKQAQLPPETVAAVEAILAGGTPPAGSPTTPVPDSTATAEAAAAETGFDIPKPVLECAPPPDFTQPDAAAGLGFPDGVPLILPLSDYYRTAPPRGDGQDVDPPSPVCFAVESAKDDPLEAMFWALGLVAAIVVAARWRGPRWTTRAPAA